jgi:hypothetical protein
MDIDKLIRVYQKRFEKTVNASRILPSLLSHVDTVLGVKRFLEGLKGIGVREVVLMKLPRDTLESGGVVQKIKTFQFDVDKIVEHLKRDGVSDWGFGSTIKN